MSWQGPGTAKAQIPDSAFETIDSQSVCAAPGCGDGVIGSGESCDDGNTVNGDGCNASCNVETGFICEMGTGEVAFKYYEETASPSLLSWFGGSPGNAPATPVTTGFLTNMQEANITPEQAIDALFVFDLNGVIDVPTAGTWTFFTSSDDG